MTGKTHLAFNTAVIAALFATGVVSMQNIAGSDAAVIGGIVLGSLLPDLDNPNSTIRHKIRRIVIPKGYRRLVSSVAMSNSSFHHRKNCTHWPLFWLAVCTALYICLLAVQPWPFFFVGLAIGTVAHLFCDLFNPYGIMLLAPFSHKKFKLAKIPTNSIGEIFFLLASILAAFLLLAVTFHNS